MIGLHVGAHHGLGRTTHMHEDERRVFFFGNGKHVGITRSRRNIVDDIGSRVKGGAGRRSVVRINGKDGLRISPADFRNSPDDTADFFFCRYGITARAGRFTANIKDIGTVIQHLSGPLQDQGTGCDTGS
ncbi:unknown [Acidaminococcus intestini CAG:325]|nr:unknown [Acidaminococcus intestini CAG:325]